MAFYERQGKPGQENIVMTIKQDYKSTIAKWHFYNLLCQNEYRYSQSQKKSMLRQNIFGIYRKGGDTPDNLYSIDNFIYPKDETHIDIDTHNINNIVIKNIKNVQDPNRATIYKLLDDFNALKYTNAKTSVSFCTSENIKNETEQGQSTEMNKGLARMTERKVNVYYKNENTITYISKHIINDDNVCVLFGTEYVPEEDKKFTGDAYFYIFEIKSSLYISYISSYQAVKLYSTLEKEYNTGLLLSLEGKVMINNAFNMERNKHKIEKYIREIIGISFGITP